MNGSDLSTTIGRATGSAGFDENGKPIYRNKYSVFTFKLFFDIWTRF